MEDEKNHKMSDKFIAYVVTIVILLLLSIPVLIYLFKDNSFKKSEYIYLKDRTSYIIQNADESFLDKYYGNDNTMVVFMASWCKYCVEEQNELNNFIRNNPDKKVIFVSHDYTYEKLDEYLKSNNLNWFVIFDKDKTIRQHIDPNTNGIPSIYLLNKSGKILGFSKGVKKEVEFFHFYNNEIDIYTY